MFIVIFWGKYMWQYMFYEITSSIMQIRACAQLYTLCLSDDIISSVRQYICTQWDLKNTIILNVKSELQL